MIELINDFPVRWIDEEDGMLGQTGPVQEGTVQRGFSNAEKILLAGVIISGVGLALNLWNIFGRKS